MRIGKTLFFSYLYPLISEPTSFHYPGKDTMKQQYVLIVLLAIIAVIAGCSKDDNPVNPGGGSTSTAYVGTMANTAGTESGTLIFSVPNAKMVVPAGDTVNVSGKIYLASGDTVDITGTFIHSTGYLTLTGGGYTFTGTLSSGHLNGTYTGPNGGGGFAATSSTSGTPLKVFCGQYQETSPNTSNHGTFNMLIDGNNLTVVVSGADLTLYGTISGTTVTVFASGTSGTPVATGTIDAGRTVASGSYNTGDTQGTWSAELCH